MGNDSVRIYVVDGRVAVHIVVEDGEDIGFTMSPGESVKFAEIIVDAAKEAANEAAS